MNLLQLGIFFFSTYYFVFVNSENLQISIPTSTQLRNKINVSTISTLTAHDGLAIDERGNVYASNYKQSNVYKITRNGAVELFTDQQPGAAGLRFDKNGNLFLSRYTAGDIICISPEGNVLDTVAKNIKGPTCLDFDSKENIYVNHNVDFYITMVDKKTGKATNYITHQTYNSSSLTLDDKDNLYISNYKTGTILKVDKNLTISQFATLPVEGIGFITFSNGHFYATAIRGNQIYHISNGGEFELLAGTGAPGLLDGTGNSATFTTPNGIAATPTGDTLYVAQKGGIRMITGFMKLVEN